MRTGRLKWLRWFGIATAILAAFAAAGYALVVRPFFLRGEQIQNLTQMRMYRYAIEDFHAREGQYPTSLSIAIRGDVSIQQKEFWLKELDRWDHKVLYRSDGTQYLLVSYGRDGLPDGTDYVAERVRGSLDNSRCRDLSADLIFSDRGEHRNCGK